MGRFQNIQFNVDGMNMHSFDAIVVGSGISGGWAAQELTSKGLKTLVIERGRNIEHITDYTTAFRDTWSFPLHLRNSRKDIEENPIQSGAFSPATKHFYVNDKDHPYIQEKPFYWIRGYHVGGRSLTWGRQCYRMSDLDFSANQKDGIAVDWPIRYKDIAPWYDYVETYIGVSGKREGLAQLPDGKFLPAMEMNCVEEYFSNAINKKYLNRKVTIGRVANLTRGWNNRGPCQFRNLCDRGCPFGGYFSSNSCTLPAAEQTGNLTLLTDTIVSEIIYDEKLKRATGVRVIDSNSGKSSEYFSKVLFLNASTIATTSILLNSKSRTFPTGIGNTSNQIGHNLMDHFVGVGATAVFDGYKDLYYKGRRPVGIYMPRFRNLGDQTNSKNFLRGYGIQGSAQRLSWADTAKSENDYGIKMKARILKPGPWTLWLGAWGETLPYYKNSVKLDTEKKDKWGLPLVRISYEYGENENLLLKDAKESIVEMLEITGFTDIDPYAHLQPGGAAIHEMGTVRMGDDHRLSPLNSHNQLHDVKNVFITDGSCMTSSGTQNPSLTYMAMTARACDYAVKELKLGNL